MKFKVTTIDRYYYYTPDIYEHIEWLKSLGFEFELTKTNFLKRITEFVEIDISSFEQLIDFSKRKPIIVDGNSIEIYDGYRL
jgi:hypothetical protein